MHCFFRKDFVIVPIYKAANNVVFICKHFCLNYYKRAKP